MAAGGGVQRDIDGGMSGVGEEGAVVEGKVGVRIAKDEGGDSPALEFLAQTAREGEVTSFSASVGLRASPRSVPPWLASTTAK